MKLRHPFSRRRQRGAVLIISLVLLVVLTLLGVSVMNMTQLEERMAANVQELNQSFHTAETGLSQAYSDTSNWNPSQDITVTGFSIPSTSNTIDYTVSYIVGTDPPLGNDKTKLQTHNFNVHAQSTMASGYKTMLQGGGFVVGRKFGTVVTDDANQFGNPSP